MRKKMRSKPDKAVFKNTAISTKKININPNIPRGGIRLWFIMFIVVKMTPLVF